MNMSGRSSFYRITRALFTLGMVFVLAIMGGVASAHNLQTKMVYMFFDPDTQKMLDERIAGNDSCFPDYAPPTPLLRGAGVCTNTSADAYPGDELGIIIKVIPRDGTTTGVGGHIDFYVPNGLEVIEAAYLLPGSDPTDGLTGYDKVPMKGQSLIAVGDGPVGAKSTPQLIGLSGTYGPTESGLTQNPVDPATGLHRGTIAGVYGDTGIFYATDPDLSYGSWQRFTGNPDETCGTVGVNLDIEGVNNKITNNSGDTFVPCNKWDAEQMFAWGTKGTTCTKAGCVGTPIVDYGDGRGNAPWGFAAGTGGPESGYAWNFDWDEFVAGGVPALSADPASAYAAKMRAAMSDDEIGPWKRIKYPGSRLSFDQPGLIDTTLGIASIDAGNLGYDLATDGPLPIGTNQLVDDGSPKAIRWAVGQLTDLVPEYAWVKVRVNNVAAVVNEDGCPVFNGDTFGGDAGGDNNGKDHLWRYYEPTHVSWNACVAIGKPTDLAAVKKNDVIQYKVKLYNAGEQDLTNVVIRDTLPSGIVFVSSVPAQSSGPNPLVWNIPYLAQGDSFEALVSATVTGTGPLDNTICVTSDQEPEQCSSETVPSGGGAILKQFKTASTDSVPPGGQVDYTIAVENIGGGPSGSPVFIQERLESALSYASLVSVTINGTAWTSQTTVTPGLEGPEFSVPTFIPAGGKLLLTFRANIAADAEPGEYCNSFTTWQNGLPLTTGSLACITVGAGKIGDTIYRDWNGDGTQDTEDEGLPGVTVQLWGPGPDGDINTTGDNVLLATDTTDSNGNYLFEGLDVGDYQVKVLGATIPSGYTQTGDPDQVGATCTTCDAKSNVSLDYVAGTSDIEEILTVDFGYKPGGSGAIGDRVFEDTDLDGIQDAGEPGIAGINVILYEDTNGNGVIDADDYQVATTTTADGLGSDPAGYYQFTGLAVGLDYLVYMDLTPAGANDSGIDSYFSPYPWESTTHPDAASDTYAIETVSDLSGTYNDADFGFRPIIPGSIAGIAYQDENTNGTYDGGDVLMSNVDVTLYIDSDNDGVGDVAVATVSTLPSIVVTDGYVTGGYTELFGVAINGSGQLDINGDGLFNSDDDGWFAGYEVIDGRLDMGGNGTVEVGDNGNLQGAYWFGNLGPGNYVVDINQDDPDVPDGYSPSVDNIDVALGEGQALTGQDFPFVELLSKSVENLDLTLPNNGSTGSPTDTLEYSINPGYTGSELLSNVTVTDTVPEGSTFVSANLGGTLGTFTPVPGIPGEGTIGSASIAHVASSSAAVDGGTTLNPAKPTGTVEGDVLVAGISVKDGHLRTMTPPSGWQLIRVTKNTGMLHGQWAYYKIAGASEPASYTFTLDASQKWAMGISTYRGVDTADPIDVNAAQVNATASTSAVAPSITTTVENAMLVAIFAEEAGGVSGQVANPPSGMTERYDVANKDGGGNEAGIESASVLFAGPGATGTKAATLLTSSQSIGHLIALAPLPNSTTNTLSAGPDSVVTGGTFSLSMLLESDEAVTGVTASIAPVTVSGTASAICSLTSSSPQDISTGGSATFTWDCTTSGSGELKFTGDASGTYSGSPYNFIQSSSNTAEVSSGGGTVSWNLGSNTADIPGDVPGTVMCPARATFEADRDAHIFSSNPNNNSGGSDKLNADSDDIRHLLVHFNVSSLPAGTVVDSANFFLTVESGQNGNRTVSVRNLTYGAWVEGSGGEGGTACTSGVTWNAPNCTGTASGWNGSGANFGTAAPYGSQLGSISPAIDEATYSVAVTTAVQGWVDSPSANYGLVGLANGSDTGTVKFYSRTGGVAGSTTPRLRVNYHYPATSCSPTVRDEFTQPTYSNNNGTASWAASWVENDANDGSGLPTAGSIQVVGGTGTAGYLSFKSEKDDPADNTHQVYREANLSGATAATFSFNLLQNGFDGTLTAREELVVQASNNGGASWTTLETITTGTATGTRSFNLISALGSVSSQTRIRFMQTYANDDNKELRIDNVQIAWTLPVGTGTTTTLTTSRTLVGDNQQITISMTLTAEDAVSSITPSAISLASVVNGANADACSAASPTSGSIDAGGGTAVFTYTCDADTTGITTLPASLAFQANATSPDAEFAVGTSNSVLMAPTLTFQVTVNDPAEVGSIDNKAYLFDDSVIAPAESNLVQTFLGATIGDTIWRDWDGDGIQDADEEGIAGVTLELQDGTCTPGDTCPTTTTDADGNYFFGQLDPGTYTVVVTDIGGVLDQHIQTGDPDETGTCSTCNELHAVTLSTNQQYLDADFGYAPDHGGTGTGTIGDLVWNDADNDGIYEPLGKDGISGTFDDEGGIAGVTVMLYQDRNGNGIIDAEDAVITTTSTAADGTYSFTGLTAGLDYIVDVDQTDSSLTTYYDGTYVQSTADTVSVTDLSPTVPYLAADFGFTDTNSGAIGDQVFIDSDLDGIYDAGEPGLANVTVTLYLDSNGNGVLDQDEIDAGAFAVTKTDEVGFYVFEGLTAGNYIVDVDENDTDIPGYLSNSVDEIAVNLQIGEYYEFADFPFVPGLRKSVNVPEANVGDSLTFTLKPYLPAADPLVQLIVSDTTPVRTTYNNSASPVPVYEPVVGSTGDVRWFLGSNAAGADGFGGTATELILGDVAGEVLQDTYLNEEAQDANYGAATELAIELENNKIKRPLVQWDISQIPFGATVLSAEMRFYVSTVGPNTVNVHRVNQSWSGGASTGNVSTDADWIHWDEGAATPPDDEWANPGGDFNLTPEGSFAMDTTGYKTVSSDNLTSLVQAWVIDRDGGTGTPNYGVLLNATGADNGTDGISSSAVAGQEPLLVVTYTEAPTVTSLSTSAAVATSGDSVVVTLDIDAVDNLSAMTITPPAALTPTAVPSEGVTVGLVSGPDLFSSSDTIPAGGGRVSFTYTYQVTTGSLTQVTFDAAAPTSDPSEDFATSMSPSVIVTPPLSYQAIVTAEPNEVDPVTNIAQLQSCGLTTLTPSTECIAIADSDNGTGDNDAMSTIDPTTGAVTNVGLIYYPNGTTRADHIETAVWSLDGTTLYTVDRDDGKGTGADLFGTLNTSTATFTPIGNVTPGQPLEGALGSFTTADIDGMAFDPVSGDLYAVHRREGGVTLAAPKQDLLLKIDPATGRHVEDAFGPGLDYVVIQTSEPNTGTPLGLGDVDDIAFDPGCGLLYGTVNVVVTNTTAYDDHLVTINPADGTVTVIGPIFHDLNGNGIQDGGELQLNDIEGLSFADDGILYAATADGDSGGSGNPESLWTINPATGAATLVGSLVPGGTSYADYESLACKGGSFTPVEPIYSNEVETAVLGFFGDTVWIDTNGNGVQDVGEPGLAGVTIELRDGICSPGIDCPTTTTDEYGFYGFYHLDAVTYTAALVESSIPGDYLTTTPDSYTYTLTGGEYFDDADFGLWPAGTASIGDYVWYDENSDGVQDGAESGLCCIDVELFHDVDNDGRIEPSFTVIDGYLDVNGDGLIDTRDDAVYYGSVNGTPNTEFTIVDGVITTSGVTSLNGATVTAGQVDLDGGGVTTSDDGVLLGADGFAIARETTDSGGNYLFENLPAGDYLVNVLNPPEGSFATTGTTEPHDVALTSGEAYVDADFGYDFIDSDLGSIGDYVWRDLDGDGVQDTGEPPIEGAFVFLYEDTNGNGIFDPFDQQVAFAITDSLGDYTFTNVLPGNYFVDVYEDSFTEGGDRVLVATTDEVISATISCTPTCTDIVTADFGYFEGAAIEGTIFHDEDRNELFDASESGVGDAFESITVTITGTDALGNPVTQTVETDENGHYKFVVPEGTYTITYDLGDVALIDPTLTVPTTSTTIDVTVQAGQNSGEELPYYNFGVDNSGSIGDLVWNDADGDGVRDLVANGDAVDETGISGVTVKLYFDADNSNTFTPGDTFISAEVTDGSGAYLFEGLPDGEYVVVVDSTTLPEGYDQTGEGDPGTACTTACDGQIGATVSGGGAVTNVDFGYNNSLSYPVSGKVFADDDSSGGLNGAETGIGGVTVNLVTVGIIDGFVDVNGDGVIDGDDDGTYGGYNVIDGYIDYDGDGNVGAAETAGHDTCTGACSVNGFDIIDGRVDVDGNGAISASDDQPESVFASVTTDSDGNYTFPGVPNGEYLIKVDEETLPSDAFVQTGEGDSPGTSCTVCDSTVPVTVNGASPTDQYFGYFEDLGSISGVICKNNDYSDWLCTNLIGGLLDLDGNGTIDANDSGTLNGVTIVNGYIDLDPGTAGYEDGTFGGFFVIDGKLDLDNNGIADDSLLNTPVSGVNVFLTYAGDDGILGTADDVIKQTTTDADGNYSYSGLEPGVYQVSKIDPATLTSLEDSDGGNASLININLAVGEDLIHQDFELQDSTSGAIGDTVWLDTDRDGIQDIGEPGIANVTVELAPAYEVDDGYINIAGGADTPNGSNDDAWLRGIQVIDGALDMNGDGVVDSNDTTGVGGVGTYFDTVVIDGRLDLDGDGVITAADDGWTGGTTIATDVTDTQGNYLFTGLATGNYLVLVNEDTLPGDAGDLTETAGTTNASDVIMLAPGETDLDVDFGYVTSPFKATIGNYVWSDADNDGEQDDGEPGIGGVTINLLDSTGSVVATTTTAADGSYYFFDVDPGRYTVDVTDTGGVLTGYTLTIGDQSSTSPTAVIDVIGGEFYDKADFGYYSDATYSISDTTWYDADRDGVFDPGEEGLVGVTVDLVLDENGDGVTEYDVIGGRIDVDGDGQITTADDTGAATLGGYTIIDGFVDWNDDGFITDADDGSYGGYQVIDGVIDLNGSGSTPPNLGSIGDQLWIDTNGDGIKQLNEAPLTGVTVELCYDALCTTSITTVTDANGRYVFHGLAAGDYWIDVDETTLPDGGTYLQAAYDEDGGTATPDGFTAVTLEAGEIYDTADFAYAPTAGTAVIGDRIWSDYDGDGVQDAGEIGIGGVTVELNSCTVCDGSDNTFVGTTTTAADGSYMFTNVAPGSYSVIVTDTVNVLDTYTQTGDPDAVKNEQTTVTVAAGDVFVTADFGYQDLANAHGLIGDTVFFNTDADEHQDASEPGIPGVTLDLYTCTVCDGSDDLVLATTTTRGDGSYEFSGLPAGTYYVEVTDTAGVLVNMQQINDPDDSDPHYVCIDTGCDDTGSSTIITGETDREVDFGYYLEDSGTISPEPVIATTISDENGDFTFSGLEDGNYVVVISDNTGQLINYQGTTPEAQDGEAGITVAGSDVQGDSFGYVGLGPIGDTIWSDADGDGIQDVGEAGISGVDVNLYYDDGDGIFEPGGDDVLLSTVTTDSTGHYEFNDLPAGTFWVAVDTANLTGYTQSGDPDGCTGVGTCTTPHVTQVTLSSTNPSNMDADFGYQNPDLNDVSGTVWRDLNRNAVYEQGSEPVFAGVTVELVDSFGNVIASTITDANGDYSFPDVPAGDYTVVITDEHDVLNGFYLTSGLDAIPVSVSATPGTPVEGVDFGYARATGTGSIGDTVWIDSNGDGIYQANEGGVSNVDLTLYADRDGNGTVDTTVDIVSNKLDLNSDGVIDAEDSGRWFGVRVINGLLDVNGDGLITTDDDGVVNGYTITDGQFVIANATGVDGAWAVTTTDADGNYLFRNLPQGSYLVDVDETDLPANVESTTGTPDTSGTIYLANGEAYRDADFGYQPGTGYALLGDTVWYDVDGDGIQDEGESGIGGVDVIIIDDLGNIVTTVTTNPDGSWLAEIPETGTSTYFVFVDDATLPGGITTTPTNLNGGDTYQVTVTDGDVRLSLDFGYDGGAGVIIGDTVFLDSNGDGVQDLDGADNTLGTADDEPGISGATLQLKTIAIIDGWVDYNGDGVVTTADSCDLTDLIDPCTGYGGYTVINGALDTSGPDGVPDGVIDSFDTGVVNGYTVIDGRLDINGNNAIDTNDDLEASVVSSTSTDVNGNYLFSGLLPGDYRVDINFISGLTLTTANDPTGVITVDADAGTTAPEQYLEADFGFKPRAGTAVIGDRVWSDADSDGVQDPGEAGLDGVQVFLDTDSDGTLDWTDGNGNGTWDPGEGEQWTTTDPDGSYLFTNVAPGTYDVVAVPPAGATQTGDPDATLDNKTSVTVAAGDTYVAADFGYQDTANASGTVSGTVYDDNNTSYDMDAGDAGITNVPVYLYDCGADGVCGNNDDGGIVATTTTADGTGADPAGYYEFTGLPDGNYQVIVGDDFLVLGGKMMTEDSSAPVTVDCSDGCDSFPDLDFGYSASAEGSGSIGDTVYFDTDGDGTQDVTEVGIPGVTLDLYTVRIIDGLVDVNGDGRIDASDDGTYGGYAVTDGVLDASAVGETINGYPVLASGAGGALDVNGDSVIDSTDDKAPVLLDSTVTGPGGQYSFSGLPAGDYLVVVSDDNNLLSDLTSTEVGGVQTVTCPTVDTCDQLDGADFGYQSTTGDNGTIGGTVWRDTNEETGHTSAYLDSGEPGIEGVTVELWLDDGDGIIEPGVDNLVRTTTTDANGDYLFLGLPPGDYIVNVVNDKEVIDGLLDMNGDGVVNGADDGLFNGYPVINGYLDLNEDGIVMGDVGYVSGSDDGAIYGVPVIDGKVDLDGGGVGTSDDGRLGDGVLGGLESVIHDEDPGTAGNQLPGNPDYYAHEDEFAVTLGIGEVNTTVDFAYAALDPYSISGVVFEDNGASKGTYNDPALGGENPDAYLVGVTVELYVLVDGVEYLVDTTVTDGSGAYTFNDLANGMTYVVKVDVSGTDAESWEQTFDPDDTDPGEACTNCDSVTTVTISGAPVTDLNFGYWNGDIVTTPVTLSYFEAASGEEEGDVQFSWTTVTEAGNLGFVLYMAGEGGARIRISDEPIPALPGGPSELRNYSYFVKGVTGAVFYLVDIDVMGYEIERGPFELDRVYGRKDLKPNPIDVEAIKQEHEAKKQSRKERKKEKMKEKLEKQKGKLKKDGRWESASVAEPNWATRLAGGILSVLVSSAHAAELPVTDTGLIQLHVTESGVYRVTYEALAEAGLDLAGVDFDLIALTNRGEPVPLNIVREGGGKKAFGKGWYFEFLGEEFDSMYSKTNVYTLYLDGDKTAHVVVDDSKAPKKAEVEPWYMASHREDTDTDFNWSAPGDDPWYMALLRAWGAEFSLDLQVDLDGFAGNVAPLSLDVELWGALDWQEDGDDHHVEILFNGVSVADEWFDGLVLQSVRVDLQEGAGRPGINDLTLRLPLDTGFSFDRVNLNAYEVRYPRFFVAQDGRRLDFTSTGELFEVQGFSDPNVLVYRVDADGSVSVVSNVKTKERDDGTFVAGFPGSGSEADYVVVTEGDVRVPIFEPAPEEVDITGGQAKYLVIAHPDFIGVNNEEDDGLYSLEDLLQARVDRGFSVLLVDLEQVYAQFSHGLVDANAIREYVAYAFQNMDTEMVLLVGGDTFDYHGILGPGPVSFVPSLYAQTDQIIHFAPVDSKYVDVNNDNVPDLAIGRFPVRTSLELSQLVHKTLVWEAGDRNNGEDAYGTTGLFIADGYDAAQEYDFKQDSEEMLEMVPWEESGIIRAYLDDMSVSAAKSTIIETLNAGVALTSFVGHSSAGLWTFDRLFKANDAIGLTNNLRPTVLTQWGCWNTYYVSNTEDTMAHEFLLNGEQGAVAVLGASTLTEASHESRLSKLVYDGLFLPGIDLGTAVLAAKQAYANQSPEHLDVILGWTLLGDPALQLTQ